MAYEYSSESKQLEFPNPFRVENLFWFLAAAILGLGGVGLLLLSRAHLAVQASSWALMPLLMGLFLFLQGLIFARQAMSRLRFFFGRGQPLGLAPELTIDQVGSTPLADLLKEKLRQNSLFFQEPSGPLNGLLYSVVRNLIYAPMRIQWVAQRQFQNGLALLATLASLVFSSLGASPSEAGGWLAIFFFGFTMLLLLKPLGDGASATSGVGLSGLVVLILVAILGPVVIPMLVGGHAAPGWVPGLGVVALILVLALAAVLLFFLAVIHQSLRTPPTANMAVRQTSLSMNAHPKQLIDELERELQLGWVESIPNRRYARVLPDITAGSGTGSFRGELLEETQPLPRVDLEEMTLANCFADRRYRWLGWLNVYGVLLMSLAVGLLATFAATVRGVLAAPVTMTATTMTEAALGVAAFILGGFCFRAGNVLWGRFEFVSQLYWIELAGNYQSAEVAFGAPLTDRVRTQKQVLNIETMTLRVWAAQLETVSFGKDSGRFILGMLGLPDKAEYLQAHLGKFAGNQSIMVAPASDGDLQRAEALGALGRAADPGADPAEQRTLRQVSDSLLAAQHGDVVPAAPGPRFCASCGTQAQPQARFCMQCGSALNAGSS